MFYTRTAFAALALTASSVASAAVTNVIQADFGVISPLPYSRSFGDTFNSVIGTAGYTTSASSSHITGTINTNGSIDGSVVNLPLGPQFPGATANFNFYDDYLFTMPGQAGALTASAVSVSFGSLLGINNLQVRFYAVTPTLSNLDGLDTGNPSAPLFVGWQSVTALSGGSTLNVSTFSNPLSLSAGVQYALEIRGEVYGPTASYGGNLNVSPVPEADGFALVLAGLGVAGLVASRRRVAA